LPCQSKPKKKFSLFSSSKKDSTPTVRKDMISAPLDFVHEVHVGFDSETQEFSGLPDTWRSLLKISGTYSDCRHVAMLLAPMVSCLPLRG